MRRALYRRATTDALETEGFNSGWQLRFQPTLGLNVSGFEPMPTPATLGNGSAFTA